MTIILEGKVVVPDDASQIRSIGEFFGYDTEKARAVWDEAARLLDSIKDDAMSSIIPKFLKALDGDPDNLLKFFYLTVSLGAGYSRRDMPYPFSSN